MIPIFFDAGKTISEGRELLENSKPNKLIEANPIFSNENLTFEEIKELAVMRSTSLDDIFNEDIISHYRIDVSTELKSAAFYESDEYKIKSKEILDLKKEALKKTYAYKVENLFDRIPYDLENEGFYIYNKLDRFKRNDLKMLIRPLCQAPYLKMNKEMALAIEKECPEKGSYSSSGIHAYIFYMIDEPESKDATQFVASACRVIAIRTKRKKQTIFFDKIYK